jgi:hypothetical protein
MTKKELLERYIESIDNRLKNISRIISNNPQYEEGLQLKCEEIMDRRDEATAELRALQ